MKQYEIWWAELPERQASATRCLTPSEVNVNPIEVLAVTVNRPLPIDSTNMNVLPSELTSKKPSHASASAPRRTTPVAAPGAFAS